MNVGIQQLIADRLDQLKDKGFLSEYLISWKGQAGRLDPNVTVWATGNASQVVLNEELRWLIGDLVRTPDNCSCSVHRSPAVLG